MAHSLENQVLKLSKIEATQRQLDCAIDLWFQEKDDVSVHTLAAAAYQIIQDIYQSKQVGRDMLYDTVLIKDQYRKQFVDLIRQPQNFFKHADKDPDGSLEFMTYSSLVFMLFAMLGLSQLGHKDVSNARRLLITWLLINKPDYLEESYRKTLEALVGTEDLKNAKGAARRDFYAVAVKSIGI